MLTFARHPYNLRYFICDSFFPITHKGFFQKNYKVSYQEYDMQNIKFHPSVHFIVLCVVFLHV